MLINDLLCFDGSVFRVLAIDGNDIFVIDCIKRQMPYWIDIPIEYTQCSENELREKIGDNLVDEGQLSQKNKAIAHRRYTLIAPILTVVEDVKEDKENVLILGNDVEITRDIMGYSLLSVVCNAATDSDFLSQCGAAFYANGEMLNPQNSADLFNVVKTDFADIVENVSSTGKLVQAVADLYSLYQTRIADAENSEELKTFSPYYIVIHNFQRYVDTFNANGPLPSDGVAIDGSGDVVQNKTTGIADAFKAMYLKGGKVGIHFIISVDNPNAFISLKRELFDCRHIVVTKGVNRDLCMAVFGDVRSMNICNPQVAIVQNNDEQTKIKPYRYDIGQDDAWYCQ